MSWETVEILRPAERSPFTNLLNLPMRKILRIVKAIEIDPSGCWHWQGGRGPKGYGRMYVAAISSSQIPAHRLVYMLSVGAIPEDFDLHHRPTCQKCCVNPDHLTPMKHGVHSVVTNKGVVRAKLTHCKRGHEFTPESSIVNPKTGKRQCRICSSDLQRERYRATHHGRVLLTHCMRGHEFTPENTVIYSNSARISAAVGRAVSHRQKSTRQRTARS